MKYKSYLHKWVVNLLFIIHCLSVSAQVSRFYSTDDGISNSLINSMLQDKTGYIWIASEYGLNKFNGYNFTNYYHTAGDTTSLINNYVRTLFEDSQGTLYVGTMSGLMKYKESTDSFEWIPMYNKEGRVVQAHVVSLLETTNGDILISTSGRGVFELKSNGNKCVHHTVLSEQLSSNYLNLMIQSASGDIWIGTDDNGLNLYQPGIGKTVKFYFPGNAISALAVDNQGIVYVGAQTKGLYKYEPQADVFHPVPNTTDFFIKSLRIDPENQIYVATDGQGLKVYDPFSNKIEEYTSLTLPFDFSHEKVHTVLFDHAGNMWLGVFQKGVIFSPVTKKRFDYLGNKLYKDNPIGFSCVTTIRKDRDGILWIGTDSDGIYGVDKTGKQVAHYRNTPGTPSVPGIIQSICEDSKGNLWLGSYADGLAKMDKHTGKCTYIEQLADARIFYVTQDRNGLIWVATYKSGVCYLNPETEELKFLPSAKEEHDNFFADELPSNAVNTLLCDEQGLVWIGHFRGLSCYDTENKTFLSLNQQNNTLHQEVVFVLRESSNGELLVGTANGLFILDKQTLEYTHYTMADGLPSDVICGICEDESGLIWMSTYQGLSKYNRKENTFVNYSGEEGLQGNEFTRGAQFIEEDGKIWFGGVNGVTGFYPENVVDIQITPSLTITQLYLQGHPVKVGDKSGTKHIITRPVTDAKEINLAWHDNSFRIEFTSMNYEVIDRIIYQYQLEGVSGDWQNTHLGTNWISFNNLPPGKYTLNVRAKAGDNYSPEKKLQIIISPPWYQTHWAYLLYALLLLLIAGILFYSVLARFRYKQEIMKREYSEKINESKLQFFTNVSHEIRSPMTLIINPLEKLMNDLKEHEDQPSPLMETYTVIYRNARRILRLVNQLMDVRKLEKGQMKVRCQETNIVHLIEDLMHTYDYLAKKKNIRFSFSHETNDLNVWVDPDHFDKVLLNVFSNAFKYTPEGGEILVSLNQGTDNSLNSPLKHFFEIRVEDTGIGIDSDKLEAIFERFYQVMDHTRSNFGTGIGLHLSRSLVQLHKGVIYAENRKEQKGTCFIIRLPLGNAHLSAGEMGQNLLAGQQEDNLSGSRQIIQQPLYNEENKIKSKNRQHILISEDDEEIRSYLVSELSSEYQVTACADGKKALDILLKMPFDLLISDIMMPEMDGITLCRKIKRNIRISHIPVILLTARAQTEDKLEGLRNEADAYLVKPFNPEELKYTIHNLISNRQRLKNKFSGQEEQEVEVDTQNIKSPDEILLGKIMAYIADNLSNPELNVEMLSKVVGLSRVHMHRKLKALTNQSPSELIRNVRLKHASGLLKSQKYTITEVAYATGFTNLSHFSTSFKEYHGISPTEFLQQKNE